MPLQDPGGKYRSLKKSSGVFRRVLEGRGAAGVLLLAGWRDERLVLELRRGDADAARGYVVSAVLRTACEELDRLMTWQQQEETGTALI